jgi:hypothetical protein
LGPRKRGRRSGAETRQYTAAREMAGMTADDGIGIVGGVGESDMERTRANRDEGLDREVKNRVGLVFLCPRWGTILHKLNNLRGSIKIVQLY